MPETMKPVTAEDREHAVELLANAYHDNGYPLTAGKIREDDLTADEEFAVQAILAALSATRPEAAPDVEAAQLNLFRRAERDREARRRAEEAFDLIAPWAAKFAEAASFYDGGRPCYPGSTVMLHDADPGYSCALTSTATGIGGPGAPASPTLNDLRLLACAYEAARTPLTGASDHE